MDKAEHIHKVALSASHIAQPARGKDGAISCSECGEGDAEWHQPSQRTKDSVT